MKTFALIAGSLRKESINRKLLEYIKETYKIEIKMEFVAIHDFPLFNEDTEAEVPEQVKKAILQIQQSDGVLIATPEYNHSVPGALKNALDWLSRKEKVFVKKPVLIMGCSIGEVGTSRAQNHLRLILNSPGHQALTLPGNEILIGQATSKFNEKGTLTDEKTMIYLNDVIKKFILWIDATQEWQKEEK
ncbi:NADPH-dependent FMN reductase [Paenisporosarcina sp. NPDC076898]|uniref:NADPH-dependent FMN reductase n=1 Tax=unclassified Paenisporosarcina TaxID=2642018 RepID=UPI003D0482E9